MAENERRFRIFLLGAGFSKAAGYPLGNELWDEIRRRARNLNGRAGRFTDNLQDYIRFKVECDGLSISEDDVDFEDFMRFLDIEHFLGLRGSDTWSRDGNEATVVVKTLIGQILTEKTPSKDKLPQEYLTFADGLQPDDIVLTFNYDTLLETALEVIGKPFRLFPNRYKATGDYVSVIDDSRDEVVVLKLHGSIDWFDRGLECELEAYAQKRGMTTTPRSPVFADEAELGVSKLLDEPRCEDDALNQMYRVKNLRSLYAKNIMFRATPWLLSPSTMKILYADRIRDFWYGMNKAGILNFGLSIIGYSLPCHDEYARQILYSLVTNYQRQYSDTAIFGLQKTPIVVVDLCEDGKSLADFKRRYAFVDWNRAKLYPKGFDTQAVELVHTR